MGPQQEREKIPFLKSGGESGRPLSVEEYTQKLNGVLRRMFYGVIADLPEGPELDLLMGIIDGDDSARVTLNLEDATDKIIFDALVSSDLAVPSVITAGQLNAPGYKKLVSPTKEKNIKLRVASFSFCLPEQIPSDFEVDEVELSAKETKNKEYDFQKWVFSRKVASQMLQ